MDQSMDWLIELDCASAERHAEFQAWLAADPANREAFSHAQTLWNSNAVAQAAAVQARQPAVLEKIRGQWKPLATAAVLLLSLTSFSNLPIRLQADHLTQVGERQRLQLADGSKILLNTNSTFSIVIEDRQRSARLHQGRAEG
jgi:transmembrane sensor